MPTQIADVVYCPDLDTAKIPGSLTDMYRWAPLQSGFYGSSAIVDLWTVTSIATLGKTFPAAAGGSVRFLVFSDNNIDEYTSTGTKTNRGTGYTTNLTWSAAQWGDQIIATNYVDAVQSSTTGAFTALSGSPPKARLVAANVNFVMLAGTNDGSTAYQDEVYWSGLQNPATWTPSLATQCGRIRLVDTPGPIRQLIAFKDKFYAFKENSIYVGEYVGPPYIFQWRLVSAKIGAVGFWNQGVTECEDALWFAHSTGFYRFDGAQLTNVGVPVWRTILNTIGFGGAPKQGVTSASINQLRIAADDVEGVVWIMGYVFSDPYYPPYAWGYNVHSNKWAAHGLNDTTCDPYSTWVQTNHTDMRTFLGSSANVSGRIWRLSNVYPTSKLHEIRYPYDWNIAGTFTTGLAGDRQGSTTLTGLEYRIVYGSDAAPFTSCTLEGYNSETLLTGSMSATATVNTDLERFDGKQSAKFHRAIVTGTVDKTCVLAGIGLEVQPRAKR
jgi:hypothetical protein